MINRRTQQQGNRKQKHVRAEWCRLPSRPDYAIYTHDTGSAIGRTGRDAKLKVKDKIGVSDTLTVELRYIIDIMHFTTALGRWRAKGLFSICFLLHVIKKMLFWSTFEEDCSSRHFLRLLFGKLHQAWAIESLAPNKTQYCSASMALDVRRMIWTITASLDITQFQLFCDFVMYIDFNKHSFPRNFLEWWECLHLCLQGNI